jgi:hypothetical protein
LDTGVAFTSATRGTGRSGIRPKIGGAAGGYLFGETPAGGARKFFSLDKDLKEMRVKPAGQRNTLEMTEGDHGMATRQGMVVIVAFLAVLLPNAALSAEEERADATERDLAALRGKWEMTVRTRDGTIRSVQTIDGTTSTVDRYGGRGELIQSHTAHFKLNITDQVRVFTYFDLEVTAGSRKGVKFKGPLSFIYVLERDTWVEARGLLVDQEDGEPRLVVWKRVTEKLAANK